jgi:hypothetical protein
LKGPQSCWATGLSLLPHPQAIGFLLYVFQIGSQGFAQAGIPWSEQICFTKLSVPSCFASPEVHTNEANKPQMKISTTELK